jgi:flagellin-like protein
MKGISEVIAVLMMIVVTLGLIGVVAYFLFSTTKKGVFSIIDAQCTAGTSATVKIVATYNGADATPADVVVEIRNKLTGAKTPYSSPTIYIYKGTTCNIYTVGATGCNTPASATNPVTSGETVGIQLSAGNIASGTGIDITIRVFGQASATYPVTCY